MDKTLATVIFITIVLNVFYYMGRYQGESEHSIKLVEEYADNYWFECEDYHVVAHHVDVENESIMHTKSVLIEDGEKVYCTDTEELNIGIDQLENQVKINE